MKPTPKPLLIRGNAHLGEDYWQFSMPARLTCPGMTEACEDVCYALDFLFIIASNRNRHLGNYERARDDPRFAEDLHLQIRFNRIKKVRIHVAGDFFSAAYIDAWTWVAKRSRTTEFLFYTRSWRVPELVGPLVKLAKLPNVFAHWSEDRDTGPCDLPHAKRAFLCTNLQDELLVPPGVLVFREKTGTVAKFVNGSWVCAKEQGTRNGITCSSCGQCVNRDPWPASPGGRGRDVSASGAKGQSPSA